MPAFPPSPRAVAIDGGSPDDDLFTRLCARLNIDTPDRFAPRRPAVLSALEAATRLSAPQQQTIVRIQHPRLRPQAPGRALSLGSELSDAFRCVREEARLHGRLAALGQAWAASQQLIALVTMRQPAVAPIIASAVAGEVLCRMLDDISERRALSPDDEQLLRCAWRAAHPPPAYFRRPPRP